MKTTTLFFLLAVLSATSSASAEPCSTVPARYDFAATLRLAAEERPVNVTFLTKAEGVKMADYLKAKYPDEMTIILQYEFERLNVKDDRFEVLVWFKGRAERLVVPFNAIKAFWDKAELKCSGN